jgi:hypothetical protein
VSESVAARRAVRDDRCGSDDKAVRAARVRVDVAKRSLGERGSVWWSDGAPDLNRHMARTTIYALWFESLTPGRIKPAGTLAK